MHNHNITDAVDNIVSDLGYYSPIELLLRQGRLRYGDYESWRYGQVDFIAEQFMGSTKRINTLLSSARDYLLALDFTPEACEFYGWQGSKTNQLLAFCASGSEVETALLNTQYRRKQAAPQLDLFFDNQGVQLANELIQALAGRDAELAEQKLEQLELVDPGHSLCGAGAQMLTALQQLQKSPDLPDPAQHLDELQNYLLPLVKESLQGRMRDFMAPFWRRLAVNLDTDAYTEDQPQLHPAYCYAQILLWPQVIDSIRNTPHWRQCPSLYGLLSEACYQDKQRIESIQLVCDFCWRFPQQKPAFIADAHTLQQWSDFIDLELDEEWGQYHFPAWLLLHEAGLAGNIKADEHDTPAAFILLQQLLLQDQHGNHQQIELRTQLKAAHGGIFGKFLSRFGKH